MTAVADSPSPVRVRSYLPLASTCLAVGIATALATPFLSLFLTRELGADPVALGGFLLATPIAGVVVSTLIGRLSDRREIRRLVLLVGGVAGAAGWAAFVVVRDYWALLAVSVTVIAVSAALIPQVFAFARQVSERSGSSRAPVVVSALRTVISVSWVAGPPLAALLLATTGFKGLFAAVAVCYAAVAALTVWLPRASPETTAPPADAAGEGGASSRLWLAVPALVLIQAAGGLGVTTMPLFVSETLHGTEAEAGLVLGLCAALEIPLMVWFGVLATRVSQYLLVLGGAALAIVYHAIMVATGQVWQVAAAQVVNAVVIAAVAGVGISYFQSLAPGRPGAATTMFSNTTVTGMMISGPLLGVAAKVGYRYSYLMSAVMVALGVALLAAARPRPQAGVIRNAQ
ncbi:MFS transporter [Actinokineospora auranticolor]|uniref:SET family sugar efflux transporter-like MFS transporter n=1 Tax=Actinokineospora auranticolor TaxID=155976 RepID=A0A2S6GJF9_9PSEU|nr:MFS transporter [Actinokineospora auranticolor]PPK65286.1 SET family sugar efflux transporter-like MFS transporter [Actinokineospora auranticolor]